MVTTQIAKSMGQYGAHLGPVGPRWTPCCPHGPCYQGAYPFTKAQQRGKHFHVMTSCHLYLREAAVVLRTSSPSSNNKCPSLKDATHATTIRSANHHKCVQVSRYVWVVSDVTPSITMSSTIKDFTRHNSGFCSLSDKTSHQTIS